MASEFATLVESIGEPAMTVGLFYAAAQAKWEAGEATESLRLAQRVVDLADGDATMGDFVIGSPLAWAHHAEGSGRNVPGTAGMARTTSRKALPWPGRLTRPPGHSCSCTSTRPPSQNGAVLPDARDVAETAESLEVAQRSGNNTAVAYAMLNRAIILIHNDFEDSSAGLELLARAREMVVGEQLTVTLRRLSDIELARERARSGDLDGAIDLATTVLAEQFDTGEMIFRGPATTVLVEALLSRGSGADIRARATCDRGAGRRADGAGIRAARTSAAAAARAAGPRARRRARLSAARGALRGAGARGRVRGMRGAGRGDGLAGLAPLAISPVPPRWNRRHC